MLLGLSIGGANTLVDVVENDIIGLDRHCIEGKTRICCKGLLLNKLAMDLKVSGACEQRMLRDSTAARLGDLMFSGLLQCRCIDPCSQQAQVYRRGSTELVFRLRS